ncbi:helix-turn-helix transcriptional regulator [Candidatus Peregrinibacteria bacterium]|nr:helix-turn-helix transcriptional regulator [Candidatus Peregrinibacteria bacterium]
MSPVEPTVIHQLGRQIRALRKRYKLTQEKLAGRSKISLKYIQRIEGKTPPNLSLEYLQKISDGFGVPLWKLLKFE